MSEHNDKVSLGVLIGVLAFFFLIFLIAFGSIYALVANDVLPQNAIGVVEIKGQITTAEQTVKTIQNFNDDANIKAMLIRIDSPGGSVSASQEMVEAIRTIQKPTVISMGDMAASGGYYVACAGPDIYANPGTLTGSIGVISQVMEIKDLMEYFMIKVHTIKTGELKDVGSPFREFNDNDRAFFAAMGADILDQFVSHVAEARKLPKEKVMELATGRVWTGKEAKDLGLIDQIGGFQAAIDGLREKAKMKGKYTLVYPQKETDQLLNALLQEGTSSVLDGIRTTAQEAALPTESFQFLYSK